MSNFQTHNFGGPINTAVDGIGRAYIILNHSQTAVVVEIVTLIGACRPVCEIPFSKVVILCIGTYCTYSS